MCQSLIDFQLTGLKYVELFPFFHFAFPICVILDFLDFSKCKNYGGLFIKTILHLHRGQGMSENLEILLDFNQKKLMDRFRLIGIVDHRSIIG